MSGGRIFADCRLPSGMKTELEKLGFVVEGVQSNPALSEAIASHPDMNILTLCGKRFTTSETFVRKNRGDVLIEQGSERLSYPKEASLNAVCIGNDFICCSKSIDKAVLHYAEQCKLHTVFVQQGYVKCNLVVVSEKDKAVITEDCGIAKVLASEGYTVLKLNTYAVGLAPYAHGFIGGAAGTLGHIIAFTGNIRQHPEYGRILTFCSRYGKEVVSLGNEPLYDYGSLLSADC